MLELVASVCMLADPQRCREVYLTSFEDATPMQCMMMSPAELAKWADQHPIWYVRKWTCRPVGRFAKI